jgi:trans-aconitate 2-methyltransferase
VVDLGCGPGNLTETLADRWPTAAIEGLDSSSEMINDARAKTKGVEYEVGDVRDFEPGDDVDVIVSNALLQWIPGHEDMLAHWVKPGRWIAIQVPANYDEPAHAILRELCASPKWTDRLGDLSEKVRRVPSAKEYARLFRAAGCDHVDTWETRYIHQLPVVAGAPHPVVEWLSGTGMRPIRQALPDAEWEEFRADYEAALLPSYPLEGVVDFAFLRVFAVTQMRR